MVKTMKKVGKEVIRKTNGRVRVLIHTGEGMTEQAHKKECDMNYILKEYAKTGIVRHAKTHEGRYDDVSVADFQAAMFIVKEAQNMFDTLPSELRQRFKGPEQFLEFVNNPTNRDEMIKLGMIVGNDGLKGDGTPSGAPTEAPPQ